MSLEELLEMDYQSLIELIKDNNPILKEMIKDIRIKKKIIDTKDKYFFYDVLRYLNKEEILSLFDDEGIELLKNTSLLDDKLNALLTIRKECETDILKNNNLCELISHNINKLHLSLRHLEIESSKLLVEYIIKNNPDNLEKILLNISFASQQEIVKSFTLPSKTIKEIIPYLGGRSISYLLQNTISLSLNDYYFDELYSIFSKHVTVPIHYLKGEFLDKITTMYSVKDYRFLINEFSYNNDHELIDRKRKEFYNAELISYNQNNQMLERYSLCYQDICQLIDDEKSQDRLEKLEEILEKYFNFFGTVNDLPQIKSFIYEYIISKDKEGLKEYLKKESNLQMSNMIIDYHFEDIPYNFFLDIEELLHFQEKEGRTLSEEDLSIYQRLLNIDSLSYEEKMSLHKTLLENNWVEKHYDVFREAKDKASDLIQKYMLNENNIHQYYNEELSQKHGLPVYVLDGQEFYAFVKSLPKEKYLPLTKEDIESTVDGGSYSLDGSDKLNTYRDPHYAYNLIFSNFPSNQIVHMHLVDSFSKYVRTSNTTATNRVNELYTPKELVALSSNYNEIILSQKNSLRENDEVNERLGLPKMLGIYCYDEFWDIDVESAKDLGIGIVLVKTKAYDTKNINQDHLEQLKVSISDSKLYLSNVKSDDMSKRRVK